METLFALTVLIAMAAYGLSYAFINEPGPHMIFDKVRHLAPAGSELDKAISCMVCLPFYLSLVFSLIFILPTHGFLSAVLAWFAAYGIALFVGLRD